MYRSMLNILILIVLSVSCNINTVICDGNGALFLSPFIENGTADAGKRLAEVNSSLMLGLKSYAGFITVNKEYNSNLWFWYFPVEGGQVGDAPLVIWLQGGPTISSLFSLFQGVGPFHYKDGALTDNPFSWHKYQSMLFIDNPIGAGFSFTDNDLGYSRNQTDITKNLYEFLVQFMQIFPELQPVRLFLTGQSYAGKHIPSLAYEIHSRNPTANIKINLKGMAIGNGWIDPLNIYPVSEFLYQLGFIDANMAVEVKALEKAIEDEINGGNWTAVSERHRDLLMYVTVDGRIRSLYNYITDEPCYTEPSYIEFIDRGDIRDALHIGVTKSYYWINYKAKDFLKEDFMKGIKHILEKLLEEYPVMLYNGQLDVIVPYVNLQKIYSSMNWSHAETYRKATRDPWDYDRKLGGYIKIAGNFEDVLIRNTGHCVGMEKPELLMKIITAFTHDKSSAIKADIDDEKINHNVGDKRK